MWEAKCNFSRILLLFKLRTSLYTEFFLHPHQYILLSFSRGICHLLHLSRKNGSHHFQQLSCGTLSISNQYWHRGWVQTEHPSKPCTISLPPHPNLQKSSKMQLIYAKALSPPKQSARACTTETASPWRISKNDQAGDSLKPTNRHSRGERL